MIPWYLSHKAHGNQPWAVQAEALRRSEGHDRYAYFLEQGLGKTALILNDFVHTDNADIALVVAPQSFKLDWALAPEEWGVGHIPAGYWPRNPMPHDTPNALYAINYEAVSRSSDARKQLGRLFQERRVMLVVDESAAIKNPTSGFSKAVHDLAKMAIMVREANGTPIVQAVTDYYMQLRILNELSGQTPVTFRNRYAVTGGFMGKQVMRFDADGNLAIRNADELYATLDRCSFRALKKDWRPTLPPQIDVPHHLEMTDKQTRHYREMVEDFYTIVQGIDVSAELILTQMEKLRQLSSCLAMQDGEWSWIEPPEKNPKVQATFDLHEGGTGKTIIVHFYRPSGAMLLEQCRKRDLQPAVIAGGMEPEDLIREKRRFNDDPDCRVLIAQEAAAFRGHTLLGGTGNGRCHRMVFFEKSFSYYHWSQMRDRNHRGDQDQTCHYFDLITSPSDQLTTDTLTSKRDMADAVDSVVAVVRRGGLRL